MHHYRKTIKSYVSHNTVDKRVPGCTLCNEVGQSKMIYENDTMFIIPNRVSYDTFEGQRVIHHLMVIPKRHVESIRDFTDQERQDQMTIIGSYEAQGYDIYARAQTNVTRSVKHQHTHLIQLAKKRPRFFIYAEKPYILINK